MGRKKAFLVLILLTAGIVLLEPRSGFFSDRGSWFRFFTGRQEAAREQRTDGQSGITPLLEVTFLDVGQGNAVFVRSGEHCMMVDGGPAEASGSVVRFLRDQGIRSLDYIIATHYDADHISGLVGVMNVFEVKTVLNPGYEADSRIYESYVRRRNECGCRTVIPSVGESYALGDASFTVTAPSSFDCEKENNRSIGIRLTCGNTAFLMLGDAEWESEYEMVESGVELDADVYLASHHGSADSSSWKLLDAADPDTVVISAGKDNDFGHPSRAAMERLGSQAVSLYRTDLQGDITAVTDGRQIRWSCSPCTDWSPGTDGKKEEPPRGSSSDSTQVIGNRSSFRFHRPECEYLPAEHNRILFENREKALEAGYEPCGLCDP